MEFRVEHPDYPQYGFYTLSVLPALEKAINKFGPMKYLTGTYDWPKWFSGFRGWTDTINSLCWPQGADTFATVVLVIDDTREELLSRCVELQRASFPTTAKPWPYVILSASLSVGESLPSIGVTAAVTVATKIIEWKLYPLAPINLTTATGNDGFAGLWLLPLVDVRYFTRNTALGGGGAIDEYPDLWVDPDEPPADWMPLLRGYPQDLAEPTYYTPIVGAKVHPNINASMRLGEACDLQARSVNERVVCRDVRSNYNATNGNLNHVDFTGVLSDYPEQETVNTGYHSDAMIIHLRDQANRAGGECDLDSLYNLTARKVQVLFPCRGDDVFFCVAVYPTAEYPGTVADLSVDPAGPNTTDQKFVPIATLTVDCSSRYPGAYEQTALETTAKQWTLLYYWWRGKQAYLKYPAIYPVIPNGHARAIRWDFSASRYETTYIALEGVQGTDDSFQITPQPFYARITGEGSIDDNLQGFYAWTELQDMNGELTTFTSGYPRQGYVAGVDDETVTYNAGRDESGKVAVPVGLVVLMVPGVPFLDVASDTVNTPYRFTTTDLDQIVKIKVPYEINEFGEYGAIIQRWDDALKRFVDSEEIWVVVLE